MSEFAYLYVDDNGQIKGIFFLGNRDGVYV